MGGQLRRRSLSLPTCHELVTLRARATRREPALKSPDPASVGASHCQPSSTRRLCKQEVRGNSHASHAQGLAPLDGDPGRLHLPPCHTDVFPRLCPCYVGGAPHHVMPRPGCDHRPVREAHTTDSRIGLPRGLVVVWLAASPVHQESVRAVHYAGRTVKHVERFVADGDGRLRRTREYRAACRAIARDVREEHSAELKRAGPMRQLCVRARIKREIRSRIENLAPKDAHYFAGRSD